MLMKLVFRGVHRILFFLVILGFVLNLIACSNQKTRDKERQGDILRVGTPMKIKQLNPLTDYSFNILAMLLTHDTLVRLDSDLKPMPQLAASWSCNRDATIWDFEIVSGALWHDGMDVTPEDVKFTFEYLGKKLASHAWIPDLVKTITINGNHVVFSLKTPCSRFLVNCGFIVRILPRHIWRQISDPRYPGNIKITTGCGPYVFSSHDGSNARMVFLRNNSYYGGSVAVNRIEFYLDRNMDMLTLSLKKGELDMYYKYASGYPVPYLKGFEKDENISLASDDAMGISAVLGFNQQNRFMGDQRFRRALSLSIDYETINKSLFMGRGRIPGRGFVPPCFPYYHDLPLLSHNPLESNKMLDAMGFRDVDGDGMREMPDGKPMHFLFLTRYDLSGHDQLLKLLIHDFQKIGVEVKLRTADLSTWISMVRKREFDLVLFRTTPWGMIMSSGHGTGYFDSRKKGGGVLANVADPLFHGLCDAIMSTTDPDRLKLLYHDVQEYYAEQLPALALCWNRNVYPYRNDWCNLSINQIEGGIVNRRIFSEIVNRHELNKVKAGDDFSEPGGNGAFSANLDKPGEPETSLHENKTGGI